MLGYSGGVVFPLASFGEKNVHVPGSGGALFGGSYGLNGSIKLRNRIRVPFQLMEVGNRYYARPIARQLALANLSAGFTIDTKSWESSLLVAGISYSLLIPLGENQMPLALDIKALAGLNSIDSYSYVVDIAGQCHGHC